MKESAQADSRLARLSDLVFTPVSATKVFVRPAAERRNLVARRALNHRIREQFFEMPGTSLTIAQAARLFGLPCGICARVFQELAMDGEFRLLPDRRYRRHTAA